MLEKVKFLSLNFHIFPKSKNDFIDWQTDLHREVSNIPGFLSLEILSHEYSNDYWTIVLNFHEEEDANRWRESPEHADLIKRLQPMIIEKKVIEEAFGESQAKNGVTELFITNVPADKEKVYRQWLSKIHRIEAQFPGFCGVYVQSPSRHEGGNWITFLKFDTSENLDRWLLSSERKTILEESHSLIASIENHRVVTPFGSWFSSLQSAGEAPPSWKQAMIVLLVLYPIVMLEIKFLGYLTTGWDISLATFFGNAISVTLISWPFVPIAIKFLKWWLQPQGDNRATIDAAGVLLMLILYSFEVAIFWYFV